LEYAKIFGYLFVGLDSDMRVKELKGNDRPFNSLDARFKIMSSLKFVDEVTSFDSDAELKSILSYYQPDIMIIGDDYKGKEIIGREYVKEVFFFAKTPNISTTKILNNKKN